MREKLLELKKYMDELATQKDFIKQEKADFEKKIQANQNIIDTANQQITRLKGEIESMALHEYESTGNKKLIGGIGIRETKKINYDTEKALAFAKEKGLFLTLDKKAFEKSAKTLNLDFVEETTFQKVTFPSEIILEEPA